MKIPFFTADKLQDMSPHEQFQFNVLLAISIITLIALAIVSMYGVFGGLTDRLTFFAVIGSLASVLFINLYFIHKGFFRVAAWTIVSLSWFAVSYGSWVSGGLYASSTVLFPIVLIVALLLIGVRSSILLVAATIVYLGFLYIAEMNGFLPDAPLKDLPYRMMLLIICFTTLLIIVGYYVYTLNQMQKHNLELSVLEERNRIFRQLTQDIAHDLRTPVTSLITMMYLIKRKHNDGVPINDYIDRLEITGHQLKDMVEDFLQLSLLDTETKKPTLAKNILYLEDLLQDVVTQWQQIATKKHIEVTLNISTDDKSPIQGDQLQLKRVFANLIENAINYGRDHGFVHINVMREDNLIFVLVEDDGIGVPQIEHEKIFERFYRANKARTSTDVGSGNGIGLSIVKRVIELHGGTINLESEEGVGSTFTVMLPLADEAHLLPEQVASL